VTELEKKNWEKKVSKMKQRIDKESHLEQCHCGSRRTRACNSLQQGDKENDRMRTVPRMRKKLPLISEQFNMIL